MYAIVWIELKVKVRHKVISSNNLIQIRMQFELIFLRISI